MTAGLPDDPLAERRAAARSDRVLGSILAGCPRLDSSVATAITSAGADRGLSPLWSLLRAGVVTIGDLELAAAAARGADVLDGLDVDAIATDVDAANTNALLRIPALAVDRTGPGGVMRIAVGVAATAAQRSAVRVETGDDVHVVLVADPVLHQAVRRYRTRRAVAAESAADPAPRREGVVEAVLERDVEADGPAARLVDALLVRAAEEGASDVHLEPTGTGLRVRYRIDGVLRTVLELPTEHAGSGEDVRRSVLARIKVLAGLKIDETRAAHSGRVRRRLGPSAVDLRVEVIPAVVGSASHESAVLRLLAAEGDAPSLDSLGFSPTSRGAVDRITDRPQGLVLVVGPTGSGKSTTLFSLLAAQATPDRKVLTVEDPVENRLPSAVQVEVIAGKLTFADALRSFLRQDPDVILVGETRDRATAEIACEAALTGHLVFTSLHTGSAAESPLRLVEMRVEPFLVANTVSGVVSQRLVRRLCPSCRRLANDQESEALRARWGAPLPVGAGALWRSGPGCVRCRGTGHAGRLAVTEVLIVTDAVRAEIGRGVTADELGRLAVDEGMVPIREDALGAVLRGDTSMEEVLRVVG